MESNTSRPDLNVRLGEIESQLRQIKTLLWVVTAIAMFFTVLLLPDLIAASSGVLRYLLVIAAIGGTACIAGVYILQSVSRRRAWDSLDDENGQESEREEPQSAPKGEE